MREFAASLEGAGTAEEIQAAAFAATRGNGLQAGEFFPTIYAILLGSEKGPRLGAYIEDVGRRQVAEKLESAAVGARGSNGSP